MFQGMHFEIVEINTGFLPILSRDQRCSPHWTKPIIKFFVSLILMVEFYFPLLLSVCTCGFHGLFTCNSKYIGSLPKYRVGSDVER